MEPKSYFLHIYVYKFTDTHTYTLCNNVKRVIYENKNTYRELSMGSTLSTLLYFLWKIMSEEK